MVDAQPVEGAVQLLARLVRAAPAGLGGQEKAIGLAAQPGLHAQLGIAVARGDVDVVDAVLQQDLERAVGDVLGDPRERGPSEDDAAAVVARAPEGQGAELLHGTTLA